MKNKFLLVSIVLAFVLLFACSKTMVEENNIKGQPILTNDQVTKVEANYSNYCAGCHGAQMQAFVDRKWKYGKTKADIIKAIKYGYPDDGMPAYDTTFTDNEIAELTNYILEGISNVDRYSFQNDELETDTFMTASLTFELDTIVTRMDSPWGMTFLPDGDMLVTEKSGTLYRVKTDGHKIVLNGVPEVNSDGQGGLLDVELHPNFAMNNIIYLSYSKPHPTDNKLATTAIMRAKLSDKVIVEQQDIFVAEPYLKTRHHYGSRIEFDREGYLYFSVGDRGKRDDNPQYLTNDCGKIHRIKDDGSIPESNPFVGQAGAKESIYSFGHRNPQGLAMNPATGEIWEHEHGPRGGDEVNIIQEGANYGWPVISYGINYNGTTFTEKTKMDGMEQPINYWVPSIAPCGMTFVKSNKYKGWEGDLLVGSLRYKYLNLCKVEGDRIVSQELLMKNIGRVRSVEVDPKGYVYVSVENPGMIYRLMPIEL